jgi:hypothetical protein
MTRSRVRLSLLTLLTALVVPEWAVACAVCFGDPSSPHAKAATSSVLALLIVTVVVLSAFASFFVSLIFKARNVRLAQLHSGRDVGDSR